MGIGDKLVEATKGAKNKAGEKKEPTSEELYLRGVDAYKNGDYKTAIEYFKQALKLDPNNEKAKKGLERSEAKLGYKIEKSGLFAGGASASGLALSLISSPPYSKTARDLYSSGLQAYANEKYEEALNCWGQLLDMLPAGDPAREKVLDCINRARTHLGWEKIGEGAIREITTYSKRKGTEESMKKPYALKSIPGVGSVCAQKGSGWNDVTLRSLSEAFGKPVGLIGSTDYAQRPGETQQQYEDRIANQYGAYWLGQMCKQIGRDPNNIVYIGGRKTQSGREFLLYDKTNDEFVLIKPSREESMTITETTVSPGTQIVFRIANIYKQDQLVALGLNFIPKHV
ncbi:MAG: tetratricopeptide repeat protein [Candidatus Anstonellales archaeon]